MTSYYVDIVNATVLVEEDFPLLMPRWGYVASAFVLFLIGFFGFFLNLMVILLMCKDRQLWTPLNIILFNLVCSDFSVSVLGNPFTLISALFHRWIFGRRMCVLYGFFMALLGITSITTLTVISFERYLMVTRPISSRHLSSKGAILSIMFIWSYSLALTTPPLYGWGNYVNEAANIRFSVNVTQGDTPDYYNGIKVVRVCSVNWHEQSTNTLTYILFLFAMGQLVPFTVITFSYVNIIKTMKRNSQRLGRVNRAEARATTMVFIMILSFTVAWTPYSVFALMEQFATEGIISPGVGVIPALVAKSSICYDPLIYVGMNTQFRQSIKRLFGIHTKGRSSQADRKYNHTLTSPAHKGTSINDFTTKCNSSEVISTYVKRRDKYGVAEEEFEVTNKESRHPHTRQLELCTIQENKTASDAERSGDTSYDDESSAAYKKLNVAESAKLLSEHSPVLTIIDSELTIFTRSSQKHHNENIDNILKNIYGNEAYEEHASDVTNHVDVAAKVETPKIRHSYSLDLSGVQTENRRRKLSVESKLDTFIQPKGFFKDTVVSKFFDQGSKPTQDNYKSYLCNVDNDSSGDNL